MADTSLQVQNSQMVVAARGLLSRSLDDPTVTQALAAAESIVGIVVQGAAEFAAVEDALRLIAKAKKIAKANVDEVLALPQAVIAAVKEDAAARLAPLARGDADGRKALEAYQIRVRREQEAELARQRAEAARAAAAEAELLRSETPADEPALVPPPVVVSAQRTRVSATAPMTSRIEFEMVNAAEVDPTFLQLNTSLVRDFGLYSEKKRAARFPVGRENGVVLDGVRFWRHESVVVR